jgi:hypothetical protein
VEGGDTEAMRRLETAVRALVHCRRGEEAAGEDQQRRVAVAAGAALRRL